jgi:outer membrane protein assembly factor BamB
MVRERRALAATLLLLIAGTLAGCGGGSGGSPPPNGGPPPPPAAQTDVVTYKNDVARTGQNLSESILTPANVNSSTFGKLRMLAVDGKVDAQPLLLSALTVQGAAHNVVFVATENDSVYAFDADTGALLWQVSLLGPGESVSDLPPYACDQVTPTIGITATPVIDRGAGAHGIIFVVAMSKTSSSGAHHQRLHALDVTSGAEQLSGPVDVAATYPMLGGVTTFDPAQYEERAALLLVGGTLYTSWTSHCDAAPYSGWIIAYNESTLARAAVFNAAPNSGGVGPAIWMSGGGPAADAGGNIYLLTANGAFETALDANGFPNEGDYGNSFLKLAASGSTLSVSDYFTMYNTVSESNADQDLGSGGILLLPDQSDSGGAVRHLAVGAGKDGNLYVVNRDAMGKFNASSNNIWQQLSGVFSGGVYSTPAYFNGTLYFGPNAGTLLAFTVSGARLSSSPSSMSAGAFAYPGTAPAISANGSTAGIVWAHENSNPAVLHAYDAGNLAHELYNSNQAGNGRDQFGAGNKFITPMIANGKVFVGTQNAVAVFGLLN